MKRILSIFMVVTLIGSTLTACQSQAQEANSGANAGDNNLKIVTTIFPQYDFVRQIAGDNVDVMMLLKPGSESHSFEPTPQDIKNIQNADLFIYTGGENDVWLEDILDSMGDKKPDTLLLMEAVTTVPQEVVEGMTDSHSHDDEQGHEDEHSHDDEHDHEDEHADDEHDDAHIDEHVWTSPKNAITIVEKITDLMMEKDAENAKIYESNSATYVAQLTLLDADFREVVDTAKHKTILFGDRFPFRYFADEYGLDYYAAFTGCSTETEISASSVAFLIETVKEKQLPAVFVMELSNGKIADTICEATDTQKLTMYSCHNITKDQMAEGVTYLSMMTENVATLRTALN